MTGTSRRGFIGGIVAFAALRGLPLNAATAEYYRQYLDRIEAKIRYIVADTSNGVPLNVSQGCRKDIHQNENQMNPQNQGG